MINDIYFPQQLTGEELDEYLMKGWYRMGPIIFSTNHIVYDNQLYSVYWLRYDLREIKLGKLYSYHPTGTLKRNFIINDYTRFLYLRLSLPVIVCLTRMMTMQ